jgi:hypothetical protein
MSGIITKTLEELLNDLDNIETFDRVQRIIACSGKEDVNPLRSNSSIIAYFDSEKRTTPMIVVERCPTISKEDADKIFADAENCQVEGYCINKDLVRGKPFVDVILIRQDIMEGLEGNED